MIYTVTMYSAMCDCCQVGWQDENSGIVAWAEKDTLQECLTDSGWHIGDGNEGELGKLYCPECWHYDDNDVFTVGPMPEHEHPTQ